MVRVYTVENCPYCTELKDLLNKEGVEFTEVNVNLPENEPEYEKLYEVTKCDDVPMIKIGDKILIPHVSFTSIKTAANLTKEILKSN